MTLLFTDIVGSTPLNERLGDKRWMELLREHNAIIREQVSAHQGYEVKTEGDGFMLAFSSARRAIDCAMAIQRGITGRNASAEEQIEVRVGLHTGAANRVTGGSWTDLGLRVTQGVDRQRGRYRLRWRDGCGAERDISKPASVRSRLVTLCGDRVT